MWSTFLFQFAKILIISGFCKFFIKKVVQNGKLLIFLIENCCPKWEIIRNRGDSAMAKLATLPRQAEWEDYVAMFQ